MFHSFNLLSHMLFPISLSARHARCTWQQDRCCIESMRFGNRDTNCEIETTANSIRSTC